MHPKSAWGTLRGRRNRAGRCADLLRKQPAGQPSVGETAARRARPAKPIGPVREAGDPEGHGDGPGRANPRRPRRIGSALAGYRPIVGGPGDAWMTAEVACTPASRPL